jgi:flavin-dependent dehydrogenase
MTRRKFDVVIVGARCAGASLAVHLGRAGLSVALLDAARVPSDQPMSTHLIQPPGMDELAALGVGDPVRQLSPALRAVRFEVDGREMRLGYGTGRAAHCLQRDTLDRLLQERAVDAGADLQPESRVVALVRTQEGRVCGVEVRRSGGRTETLDAALVVGADGRRSTVARLVAAREYLGYDGPRFAYWAYWRRPAAWDAHLIYNAFAGDDARIVFPTNGDRLLIATAPPLRRAPAWRGNHAAAYVADVRSFARIGSFLGHDDPVSEVRGILHPRYFFRVSAGPGWALLGDAGHHKDFVVGLGISEALRDGRCLARAVLEGGDAALERYWRQRDAQRIETFCWSRDLGEADAINGLERLVTERAPATPGIRDRLGAVMDGRLSPYRLFPPSQVARWVAAAVLRGRFDVIAPFLSTAFRAARVQRELGRRRRLAAGALTTRPSPLSTPRSAPARWRGDLAGPDRYRRRGTATRNRARWACGSCAADSPRGAQARPRDARR